MKRRAIAPCTPEAVTRLCDDQGFSVSERQAQQLAEYLELLMKWNRVMNLVGANSWETCLESLVSDSLHLARYLENQTDMAQRCAANYGRMMPKYGISERARDCRAYLCVCSGNEASTGWWKREKNALFSSPPY